MAVMYRVPWGVDHGWCRSHPRWCSTGCLLEGGLEGLTAVSPSSGVQGDLLAGGDVIGVIPVVVQAGLIQLELVGAVGLAVPVEDLGAAVGVIMALEHHVDVVLIEDGGELGAQDHAVGVGVVQTGAIDVLVDGDHTPLGVGVGGHGLGDGLLMLGGVVVVGVQHDEQARAVGVVVVAAGLGGAVIGGVGVIEVVGVVGIQRVVVADGGWPQAERPATSGSRYPAYSSSLAWPVLLTWSPAEMMKFRSGFLLRRDLQGPVQAEAVVPGGGVGGAGVGVQDSLP